MKPGYVTIVALAAAFTLQACGRKEKVKEELAPAVIPVSTIQMKKQNIRPTIIASGQFTTDDETFLSFKTGGIVQSVLVREGDAVRKGQLLAVLDPVEVNAQVQQAQLAFEKAQRDHKRVSNLYSDSVSTLEQLQNTKTALDLAHQQLLAAKFNLQHSEIRATANGYILRKLVNEGQIVGPGTLVFMTNGAHDGNWVLRVGVSDKDWALLEVKDKAEVEMGAAEGVKYNAEVSRKSEGVDPVTGSFTVDLAIKGDKPAFIASGMFGKAMITPSRSSSSWAVPYDALIEGDGSKGYVFVTDDDNTARKIEVKVGSIEKESAIIISGLESASSLIVTGSPYLTNGSKIKVVNNDYTAVR